MVNSYIKSKELAHEENREIIVEENLLRYVTKFGRSDALNLDKLQYIYLEVNDKSEETLFCFDAHHHIPVDFEAFDEAFIQLYDQLRFDRALFYATLSQYQQAKVRIWRHIFPKNYAIVDSTIDIEKEISVSKSVEGLIGIYQPIS